MIYRHVIACICIIVAALSATAADGNSQITGGVSKTNADCSKSITDIRGLLDDIRHLDDPTKGAVEQIQARFAEVKHVAVSCGAESAKGPDATCKKSLRDVAQSVDNIAKTLSDALDSGLIDNKSNAVIDSKGEAQKMSDMLKACQL
jgi:hypothetical protein